MCPVFVQGDAVSSSLAIVDYGCGNIRSLVNAFRHFSDSVELVSAPEQLNNYSKIVLPGVGAFGAAIDKLSRSGLSAALEEYRLSGRLILGICLGMQLMCKASDEVPSDGEVSEISGLGWIDAQVQHLSKNTQAGLKVPHMGWNELHLARSGGLYAGVDDQTDVYFVHSHAVSCADQRDVLTVTEYGKQFVSSFARDNVMGMQFHPEKSHKVGLRILQNFMEMDA